jgi:hypothetical protein
MYGSPFLWDCRVGIGSISVCCQTGRNHAGGLMSYDAARLLGWYEAHFKAECTRGCGISLAS